MSAAEPAIAVDQLVKVYSTTRAVDGISFALAQGSIIGLLGGNGAGKTTTLAMILGLVMPTSGTAKVLGAEMPRQRYRVLHRMNFESPYIDMPHRLTVRQNLEVFGRLYAVEDLAGVITDLGAPIDQVDAWRAEGLEVVTADPGPHEAVPARPRDLRRVTRPGRANSR